MHSPVPLIGAKKGSFRYNRRDIQFDEWFEAVSPSDAEVLIKAKLARRPPPAQPAARAATAEPARRDVATATPGDNRSRLVTRDAGIPATAPAVLERKADERDPELTPPARAKKKQVRAKPKAKAPDPSEPPAAQS